MFGVAILQFRGVPPRNIASTTFGMVFQSFLLDLVSGTATPSCRRLGVRESESSSLRIGNVFFFVFPNLVTAELVAANEDVLHRMSKREPSLECAIGRTEADVPIISVHDSDESALQALEVGRAGDGVQTFDELAQFVHILGQEFERPLFFAFSDGLNEDAEIAVFAGRRQLRLKRVLENISFVLSCFAIWLYLQRAGSWGAERLKPMLWWNLIWIFTLGSYEICVRDRLEKPVTGVRRFVRRT